jgi:hypothetical protein
LEKKRYYKYLFLSGAIWNIFVAISCILASIYLLDISSLFGMKKPPNLMWFHLYFGYVFIFGIGFYYVSKDINKNHVVVLLGILEKLLVFVASLIYFILADINSIAISLVFIDLIYACLFIEFLINYEI